VASNRRNRTKGRQTCRLPAYKPTLAARPVSRQCSCRLRARTGVLEYVHAALSGQCRRARAAAAHAQKVGPAPPVVPPGPGGSDGIRQAAMNSAGATSSAGRPAVRQLGTLFLAGEALRWDRGPRVRVLAGVCQELRTERGEGQRCAQGVGSRAHAISSLGRAPRTSACGGARTRARAHARVQHASQYPCLLIVPLPHAALWRRQRSYSACGAPVPRSRSLVGSPLSYIRPPGGRCAPGHVRCERAQSTPEAPDTHSARPLACQLIDTYRAGRTMAMSE